MERHGSRILAGLIILLEIMIILMMVWAWRPLPFETSKSLEEALTYPEGNTLHPQPLPLTWPEFSKAMELGEMKEIRLVKLSPGDGEYSLFYQARWNKGGGVVETKETKFVERSYEISNFVIQSNRLTLYLQRKQFFWLVYLQSLVGVVIINLLIVAMVYFSWRLKGTVVFG